VLCRLVRFIKMNERNKKSKRKNDGDGWEWQGENDDRRDLVRRKHTKGVSYGRRDQGRTSGLCVTKRKASDACTPDLYEEMSLKRWNMKQGYDGDELMVRKARRGNSSRKQQQSQQCGVNFTKHGLRRKSKCSTDSFRDSRGRSKYSGLQSKNFVQRRENGKRKSEFCIERERNGRNTSKTFSHHSRYERSSYERSFQRSGSKDLRLTSLSSSSRSRGHVSIENETPQGCKKLETLSGHKNQTNSVKKVQRVPLRLRRESLPVSVENKAKNKVDLKTFDPGDFQRRVLSKGLNSFKPLMEDKNRNIVMKEMERKDYPYRTGMDDEECYSEKLQLKEPQSKTVKEYKHREFAGLLSKSYISSDSEGEDEKRCEIMSPCRRVVKPATFKETHGRGSSTEDDGSGSTSGSSSSDSEELNSKSDDTYGYDEDYMMELMEEIATGNDRKMVISEDGKGVNKEISLSKESMVDLKTSNLKCSLTSSDVLESDHIDRYKYPMTGKPRITLNERFSNCNTDTKITNSDETCAFIDLDCLPSPCPTTAAAFDDVFAAADVLEDQDQVQLGRSVIQPLDSESAEEGMDGIMTKDMKVCEIKDSGTVFLNRDKLKGEKQAVNVFNKDIRDDETANITEFADNKFNLEYKEEEYEEPSPEVFEHVDLRADIKFSPITQRMQDVIAKAMKCPREVVLSRHNIDVTKHDLFTLTGERWLNDQIIEMFLTMIAKRSCSQAFISRLHPRIYTMSTYFFYNLIKRDRGYSTVRKWTKDVDIFSYNVVLVPIHLDRHWSLASIDFRVPGVFLYDSLGVSVTSNAILSVLLRYLSKEHKDKRGEEMDLSKFAKQSIDTPLQENGSDCGVFCCKVGDYLSRDEHLTFTQADVKYFRKRMIFEVVRGVLLEP